MITAPNWIGPLSRPSRPFWGPLSAILDLAGVAGSERVPPALLGWYFFYSDADYKGDCQKSPTGPLGDLFSCDRGPLGDHFKGKRGPFSRIFFKLDFAVE